MFFVQKHKYGLVNLDKVKTIDLKQKDYDFFHNGIITKLTLVADEEIILGEFPYYIKKGNNATLDDRLDEINHNIYTFLMDPNIDSFHNITDDWGIISDEEEQEIGQFFYLLNKPVQEFSLSTRTNNALLTNLDRISLMLDLKNDKYLTPKTFVIGYVARFKENELLSIPNFGRKSLNELKELLSSLGLKLEMKLPKEKGRRRY